MQVYNTLNSKKEEFKPLDPAGKKVSIYVCGVTVYDECHLGHARAYLTFDIVRRYLEYKGYEIKAVQNFTDVDDKIINRARELLKDSKGELHTHSLKEACRKISEKYIEDYYTLTDKLNIRRADIYPKATEHILQIINLVQKLIDTGHAYVVDGDVYFRIKSFSEYGKLSGRKIDDMEAGARVDVDARKEDPMDFVLWKSSKPEEPSWESPWGPGRPGWHIECSAMSMEYLGETFDIHGGGKDLVFPHHENEIAQSESATGKPFVKYWLHNGFLNINKEKMSKSLGNFLTLKELLVKHDPEALRLFFLQTHYRSPVDFSEEQIIEAEKALERFYNVFRIADGADKIADDTDENAGQKQAFENAMDDDFNTPKAVAVLFDLVKLVNVTNEQGKPVERLIGLLKELGNVLGLFENIKQKLSADDVSDEIEKLIEERQKARQEKNWTRSDEIRDQLKARGIVLEDTPQGVRWKRV
ncbi:MAG: cysteine--tRNA ligase [Candidatus Margulisiibacteriota bacterium]